MLRGLLKLAVGGPSPAAHYARGSGRAAAPRSPLHVLVAEAVLADLGHAAPAVHRAAAQPRAWSIPAQAGVLQGGRALACAASKQASSAPRRPQWMQQQRQAAHLSQVMDVPPLGSHQHLLWQRRWQRGAAWVGRRFLRLDSSPEAPPVPGSRADLGRVAAVPAAPQPLGCELQAPAVLAAALAFVTQLQQCTRAWMQPKQEAAVSRRAWD